MLKDAWIIKQYKLVVRLTKQTNTACVDTRNYTNICLGTEHYTLLATIHTTTYLHVPYGWKISRVENFVQFKILPYLENFAGINSTFHGIIFVSSATHEKREIKNTSKFSTRTVCNNPTEICRTPNHKNVPRIF